MIAALSIDTKLFLRADVVRQGTFVDIIAPLAFVRNHLFPPLRTGVTIPRTRSVTSCITSRVTRRAQQLLLVPISFIMIGGTLKTILPRIPLVAKTRSVSLPRSVALAFTIVVANVVRVTWTRLAVDSKMVFRTASSGFLDADEIKNVRISFLVVEPPVFYKRLKLLRQRMTLRLAVFHLVAEFFLNFNQPHFALFVLRIFVLFPCAVTSFEFTTFRSFETLKNLQI